MTVPPPIGSRDGNRRPYSCDTLSVAVPRASVGFGGPSELRKSQSMLVRSIPENASPFHCRASLRTMRRRAGLAEGQQRLGVQVGIWLQVFLLLRHPPKIRSCSPEMSVRCLTLEPTLSMAGSKNLGGVFKKVHRHLIACPLRSRLVSVFHASRRGFVR